MDTVWPAEAFHIWKSSAAVTETDADTFAWDPKTLEGTGQAGGLQAQMVTHNPRA